MKHVNPAERGNANVTDGNWSRRKRKRKGGI
jgi:hypothetical protein